MNFTAIFIANLNMNCANIISIDLRIITQKIIKIVAVEIL